MLSPILCIHDPTRTLLETAFWKKFAGTVDIPTPYLRVDGERSASLLPTRFVQMQRLRRWYNTGFPDLAYMPALLSERIAPLRVRLAYRE